jgi:hypothetical protein
MWLKKKKKKIKSYGVGSLQTGQCNIKIMLVKEKRKRPRKKPGLGPIGHDSTILDKQSRFQARRPASTTSITG